MKKASWFGIVAAVFLCTGCVYGNSLGGGLPADELEAVKKDLEDAREDVKQGIEEMKAGLSEVDQELRDIDWAEELFGTSYADDPKPKRIRKGPAGEEESLTDVEPTEDFIKAANVKTWTKKETLPEGLEEETVYYLQQKATLRKGEKDTDRYDTIARLILYQDSDYVSVVFMAELADMSFGIIPKEYLTSVYKVPHEIVDYLKN